MWPEHPQYLRDKAKTKGSQTTGRVVEDKSKTACAEPPKRLQLARRPVKTRPHTVHGKPSKPEMFGRQ